MILELVAACLIVCAQHKPTPDEVFGGGQPGAPSEAERLVERVKQQLAAVDEALAAAADADTAAGDLSTARQAHLSVIRDIEELIKQVKYTDSQSASRGGQSSKSSQGGEGSAGEPPPQSDPRESDGAQNSEPRPGSQPPQPEPSGGQPQGGEEDRSTPEQRAGNQPPPPPDTGRFERQDTDARWGLLPPKIQERLMNLHVDDLPERYRSWMDAYIRKLNQLEQGGGRP